ncbi:FtsX-like permease family protein [Clostridium tyrobutyricum]|uniref:ABC transporter permease n=1 Tax=Clostridium tyrobutyricum TaxID=1519 RepID=UPI00057E0C84|nr:FtsX-like permease family protein [Clostridium tyrobutyricum]MBV4445883.1 FtsX-like permease family protein [Clostridium tyrobutyricum]
MKLADCLKMAFSDLNKRKLRTALTSFGIAVGAMLVILMAGLGQGIQQIGSDQIKQMDTMRIIKVMPKTTKEKDKKIDEDTLDKFKKISGVTDVSASIDTEVGEVKLGSRTGKKVNVQGNNLKFNVFMDAKQNEIKSDKEKVKKYGYRPIIAGDTMTRKNMDSVLVGQTYLNKIGIKDYKSVVGKEIDVVVSFPEIPGAPKKQPLLIKAKIAGVVNKLYDNGSNVITTSDSIAARIQEYYMSETDYINKKGYTTVNVEAKNMSDVTKVESAIKKMGYETQSQAGYADRMNTMFTIIKAILIAAGAIVLIVASIGVVNTMTMSVYEKTKSIGIMKAQGASKKSIRTMFTVQSGSLGFIGSIAGIAIALILGGIVNKVVAAYKIGGMEAGMKIVDIRASVLAFTIIFTILICVIAGIVPARRAAKLNPVDALRCD